MRWIALHLPLLSLESFAAQRLSAAGPAAVGQGAADAAQGHDGGDASHDKPRDPSNDHHPDHHPDGDPDGDPPIVLLHAHRVALLNGAAQALGVQAGFKRATALALAPQLLIGQLDAARDAQALLAVGHAALAFTPSVTLAPPSAVLLEVQASLRYFGGLPALLRRLLHTLAPLGHQLHWASAPTPHGALLLARWGPSVRDGAGAVALPAASPGAPRGSASPDGPTALPPGGVHCADLPALAHLLAHAPLAWLDAAAPHLDALRAMGLHTLGDVQPLPRAGLARRFGPALLDEIDRALGAQPEPREWLLLPEVFADRLDLNARADSTEQVLHAAQMLLARLVTWATARHALVRRCVLSLQHEPRRHRREHDSTPDATLLEISLAEPSRDPAHLALLLRERLAHLPLPAPTLALRLHCDDVALQAAPHGELFPTTRSEREGLLRLVERLQARLGAERIQRLQRVDEHRPERASRNLPTHPADVGAQALRLARAAAAAASAPAPAVLRSRPLPADGFAPSMLPTTAPTTRHVTAASTTPDPLGPRPLWLLPAPQPLATQRSGAPLWQGRPLQLLCGPERIEAGWWDAALAERDYHVAQAHDGALVWLYRERLPAVLRAAEPTVPDAADAADAAGDGWYLHGLFG